MAEKPNRWLLWIPIVISLAFAGVAIRSCSVAKQALEITQATSKLELNPELRIDEYLGKNRPTTIRLFNNGPVPAIHVTVQLFSLGYDPKKKEVSVGISQQPPNYYFLSIQPKSSEIMLLDDKILTERFMMGFADAPKMEEPFHNDLLEIRVKYYRDVDNKEFGGRKFYFRAPDGEWARENQSSFPREILAAALRWTSREFPPFFELNPLNDY